MDGERRRTPGRPTATTRLGCRSGAERDQSVGAYGDTPLQPTAMSVWCLAIFPQPVSLPGDHRAYGDTPLQPAATNVQYCDGRGLFMPTFECPHDALHRAWDNSLPPRSNYRPRQHRDLRDGRRQRWRDGSAAVGAATASRRRARTAPPRRWTRASYVWPYCDTRSASRRHACG